MFVLKAVRVTILLTSDIQFSTFSIFLLTELLVTNVLTFSILFSTFSTFYLNLVYSVLYFDYLTTSYSSVSHIT